VLGLQVQHTRLARTCMKSPSGQIVSDRVGSGQIELGPSGPFENL
jgi:hypothetical protein